MATLEQFKKYLVSDLGFKDHHINDGDGMGVATTIDGLEEKADFLVSTSIGNCYVAFKHEVSDTLNQSEANRYKALSILMPNGPAAYCVIEVSGHLRLYLIEKGNEIHDAMEKWDDIRDAEDMVLEHKPAIVNNLEQWAKTTLHTENNLPRFVQLMKGCWQDIWDIENKRNDWIFDEFTRFLFIKLNEDAKPNGSFTTAKLKSYCEQNNHMGEKAAQNFINYLFDDLKGQHTEVFTDVNESVLSKAATIERVIARLEGINLKDTEGDVLGRAFEIMLSDTFKGKDLGQFFTPREIVNFMLDLARDNPDSPVLDIEKGERFLDACAGSGGFLIAAYEDVYKHILSNGMELQKKEQMLRRLGQETFYACEIEEKAARLGKLNMIVHAVNAQNAQWLHQNYLYNEEYGGLKSLIEYEVDFGDGKQKHQIGPNSIDLILTNPPFGKSVKTESILLDYQFGYDMFTFKTKGKAPEKRPKNSQESEVLFVEHYIRVLKPGGRLLIILPDGILSTKTGSAIRQYIREQTIIDAIISLPIETFMSTSAQIPTSVLILRKKKPEDTQGKIFMAKAINVGRKANGEPCDGSELPEIIENYRQFKYNDKLLKTERTGFLITPPVGGPTSRLDVGAYWKGDEFDVLSNDQIKTLNYIGTNYGNVLVKIQELNLRIANAYKDLENITMDLSSGIDLVPLHILLTRVSRPVVIECDIEYKLIGVKWYGEGAYIKDVKRGENIKAEKLFQAKSGDLIVSRLFAWKGSIAVIDESCHDAVASGEFPMYIASSEIKTEYIGSILQTPSIWADINKLCTGSSKQSRNRIHEDDFGQIQIPIIKSESGRSLYLSRVNSVRKLVEEVRQLNDITNIVSFIQRSSDYKEMNLNAIE
ncbi:N-6 DNA methylase [Clostridium estertheticum]|uniref:N-6 DNA methylase n=1 Tax=Clostridium estertheticum TaxID=238834 RepID=UPI001CF15AA6|nr:N-6 DNA methylase [Clostridium estertheticum]MCB2305626.1 N-6 DNA methylase [Clostridium estertheticum]MCB2344558.1 N-6 DNA methylase [Clostridium estertheticum]MCB2347982.1 N-6 DNA methylase [Clostridium estertheticum]WAG45626.1 N-6 DNA methylase [Clostridium estertheticum]